MKSKRVSECSFGVLIYVIYQAYENCIEFFDFKKYYNTEGRVTLYIGFHIISDNYTNHFKRASSLNFPQRNLSIGSGKRLGINF